MRARCQLLTEVAALVKHHCRHQRPPHRQRRTAVHDVEIAFERQTGAGRQVLRALRCGRQSNAMTCMLARMPWMKRKSVYELNAAWLRATVSSAKFISMARRSEERTGSSGQKHALQCAELCTTQLSGVHVHARANQSTKRGSTPPAMTGPWTGVRCAAHARTVPLTSSTVTYATSHHRRRRKCGPALERSRKKLMCCLTVPAIDASHSRNISSRFTLGYRNTSHRLRPCAHGGPAAKRAANVAMQHHGIERRVFAALKQRDVVGREALQELLRIASAAVLVAVGCRPGANAQFRHWMTVPHDTDAAQAQCISRAAVTSRRVGPGKLEHGAIEQRGAPKRVCGAV